MAISKTDLMGLGIGSSAQITELCTEIEAEVDADCAVVTTAFGAADTTNLATASTYALLGDTIYVHSGLAAAGSAITDATDITAGYGVVLVSTATNNQGLQLPVPTAGRKQVFVLNSSNNTIKIYPASGTTQIDLSGAGTAVTLASGKAAMFMALDTSGNYIRLPGS